MSPAAKLARIMTRGPLALLLAATCLHGLVLTASSGAPPKGARTGSIEDYKVKVAPEAWREVTSPLAIRIHPQYGYPLLTVPIEGERDLDLMLTESEAAMLRSRTGANPVRVAYWSVESTLRGRRLLAQGELAQVRETDGRVLLDRGFCEQHRRAMERKTARIIYGLPTPELLEVMKANPHAGVQLGGCVVWDEHRRAPAYVCPDCTFAYGAWETDVEKRRAALKTGPVKSGQP